MKQILFCTVFLLAPIAFADGFDDSFDFSDSGITGPKYEEILAQTEKLKSQYSDLVTLHDYGKSNLGRPLRLLVVMKKGFPLEARTAVFMSGSTHGNEYLNIEDRLPGELLKRSGDAGAVSEYLKAGGVFIFVPILNPDGYDLRTRGNSKGVDLNRDWDVPSANYKSFKETETKLLSNKVSDLVTSLGLKLKISVDYHCCIGALLHPLSYTDTPLPAAPLQGHLNLGEFAKRRLNVEVGTTPKILGYKPLGTTKDYYYERYGTYAFTYEGRYKVENGNLDKHISWWEDMVRSLASHRFQPFLSLSSGKTLPVPVFGD